MVLNKGGLHPFTFSINVVITNIISHKLIDDADVIRNGRMSFVQPNIIFNK